MVDRTCSLIVPLIVERWNVMPVAAVNVCNVAHVDPDVECCSRNVAEANVEPTAVTCR